MGKALVTHWGAAGIAVAGPRGGGVGAGTRGAGLGKDTFGVTVEAGFALLTVVSLSVALTDQAHSRLWVAVGGVIVTLTRSTAGAAEVKETWVAVVTLLSVHSRLAHTRP